MHLDLAHAARLAASLVLLGLAGCSSPSGGQDPFRYRDPYSADLRQFDVGIGLRTLDDAAWAPNEDLTALSADYQDRATLGPFALEGGFHYSRDRSSITSGTVIGTSELNLYEGSVGLRWNMLEGTSALRPYVGFGGSMVYADLTSDTPTGKISESDSTLGVYLKSGLLVNLSHSRHIGIEVRRLDAGTLTFSGNQAEADSVEVLVIFGTRL